MAYIIDNVNLLKDSALEKQSILIDRHRFAAFNHSFKRLTYLRMDGSSFIMTPPHILYYPEIPFEQAFQNMKNHYIQTFIKRGCTLFLTCAAIKHEFLLKTSVQRMKTKLLNSPIDYIIGVKVPVNLITPSFMRLCRRERIPAIFVEIQDAKELSNVPWGWVREAMFPYNSPLIPIFRKDHPRNKKQEQSKWSEILSKAKVPFVQDEILEKELVPKSILNKIGIIPLKSSIRQGGEVSYNFYFKDEEVNKIEELELFLYHNHRLLITVHKGTVIRAGDAVLFRPGFGEHVIIKTPSFFSQGAHM